MSPIKNIRPSSFKVDTITKGPIVHNSSADTWSIESNDGQNEGMLFIFSFPGGETRAFISYHPMFHNVEGFQLNTSFITKDMIEQMNLEMKKIHYDWREDNGNNMGTFLLNVTELMQRCEGGESCKACVLVHISF